MTWDETLLIAGGLCLIAMIIGALGWHGAILTALGLHATHRIHDQRVHDAANKEQIALSGLQVAQRRAERTIKSAVAAQQPDEARSEELKRGADILRQTLEERAKRQKLDALDAAFRGRDDR